MEKKSVDGISYEVYDGRVKLRETHSVTIHYTNGYTNSTSINGTREQIEEYFRIGRLFNVGNGEHDRLEKVTSIVFNNEGK